MQRQPKYSPEETIRMGEEWYQKRIRSHIHESDRGKVLLIDVETGDYLIGEDSLSLSNTMIKRKPDVQLYAMRIGYEAMASIGGTIKEVEL